MEQRVNVDLFSRLHPVMGSAICCPRNAAAANCHHHHHHPRVIIAHGSRRGGGGFSAEHQHDLYSTRRPHSSRMLWIFLLIYSPSRCYITTCTKGEQDAVYTVAPPPKQLLLLLLSGTNRIENRCWRHQNWADGKRIVASIYPLLDIKSTLFLL